MKYISVPEYGRISRAELPDRSLRQLQALDERRGRAGDRPVFDWSLRECVRATNYVGVTQVPGLAIEILPKIDQRGSIVPETFAPLDPLRVRAQQNLLYMLCFTRKLPVRERDLAALRVQKMPLLDALIAIFSEKLLGELRLGIDRTYVVKEENRPYLKGKLLLREHLRANALHRERFYVQFDDFVSDNWLNRIFKATCRYLLTLTRLPTVETRLRTAIMILDDVEDRRIQEHHFDSVCLTRNNERFSVLLDFCRTVLARAMSEPARGRVESFSLLFPMDKLFEEFVARFICRYCVELGLSRSRIHVQAAGRRRWMLRDSYDRNRGRFLLIPDIVIDGQDDATSLVIDTKWKHLATDSEDAKNGVSQSDLYQLYAYAHRYQCCDNLLLYPAVEGVSPKSYVVAGDESKTIRTGFVDLSRDLRSRRHELVADLANLLRARGQRGGQS